MFPAQSNPGCPSQTYLTLWFGLDPSLLQLSRKKRLIPVSPSKGVSFGQLCMSINLCPACAPRYVFSERGLWKFSSGSMFESRTTSYSALTTRGEVSSAGKRMALTEKREPTVVGIFFFFFSDFLFLSSPLSQLFLWASLSCLDTSRWRREKFHAIYPRTFARWSTEQ